MCTNFSVFLEDFSSYTRDIWDEWMIEMGWVTSVRIPDLDDEEKGWLYLRSMELM